MTVNFWGVSPSQNSPPTSFWNLFCKDVKYFTSLNWTLALWSLGYQKITFFCGHSKVLQGFSLQIILWRFSQTIDKALFLAIQFQYCLGNLTSLFSQKVVNLDILSPTTDKGVPSFAAATLRCVRSRLSSEQMLYALSGRSRAVLWRHWISQNIWCCRQAHMTVVPGFLTKLASQVAILVDYPSFPERFHLSAPLLDYSARVDGSLIRSLH